MTDALPHPSKLGIGSIWCNYESFFRLTETSDPRLAPRVKYDWARHFPAKDGILFEKSPTNSLRSRWLQKHFQPCRFVTIVRSPYAVSEGIRRRAGCSIEEAARHWTKGNECLFRDMEHLDRCMWLRYEDFCADPQQHLIELRSFLDLPSKFDERVLSSVSAASIEGRSVGVTNMNSKSLQRLSSSDIQAINHIARAKMMELGYEVL